MRHLGSFLLAIVLAPVIWVLSGIGIAKLTEGQVQDRLAPRLLGLLALLVAGLVYGVLALARLSPVGPALTGAAYLGLTVWGALDPASFIGTIPRSAFGVVDAGWRPASSGVAVLVAIPLLATLASPRRWRRYPESMYGAAVEPPYVAPVSYGAPSYSPPSYLSGYPSGYPAAETETTRPLPPGG